MVKEIIEDYFIYNGKEIPTSQIDQCIITQPSIYEVIRVIDGVPLFFEDHLDRLRQSAEALDSNVETILPDILKDVKKLISLNNSPNKNIKLMVYNLEEKQPDYIMCFIKSTYPLEEQYQKGIHTIVIHAERSNPNAKVINNELREMINRELEQHHAYEALLLNSQGEITEGSRSNLFFTVQGKIYTSPTQDVLIGITRKYIIAACRNLDLDIEEQPLPFSMVDYADGAFITGTSPKVLPISSVDDKQLDSGRNPIVLSIMKEYDQLLQDYIYNHK